MRRLPPAKFRANSLKLRDAIIADNGGCEPPQIPSIKAQLLQQLRRRDLADTI
jgi:hypothetical protein